MSNTQFFSVRTELLEVLPFFLRPRKQGQGFDKLSPNGFFGEDFA